MKLAKLGMVAAAVSLFPSLVQATVGPDAIFHNVGLQIWDAQQATPVKEVLIGYESTGFLATDLYYEFTETTFSVRDTFVPWCGILDCSGAPLNLEISRLNFPGVTGVSFSSTMPDMVERHTADSITFTWTNREISSPEVFLSARWTNAIPEPSSINLAILGLIALWAVYPTLSARRRFSLNCCAASVIPTS